MLNKSIAAIRSDINLKEYEKESMRYLCAVYIAVARAAPHHIMANVLQCMVSVNVAKEFIPTRGSMWPVSNRQMHS